MSKLNLPILPLKLSLSHFHLSIEELIEMGNFEGWCKHVGISIPTEFSVQDDPLNCEYPNPLPYHAIRDALIEIAHEFPLRIEPKIIDVDWSKSLPHILNSESRQEADPILAIYSSAPLSLKIDMSVDGGRFKLKDGFDRATSTVISLSSKDALKSLNGFFKYFFDVANEVGGSFFKAMRPLMDSGMFNYIPNCGIDVREARVLKELLKFSLAQQFYQETVVTDVVFELGDYDKYGISFIVQILNMEAYVDICRELAYFLHGDIEDDQLSKPPIALGVEHETKNYH